MTRGEELVRDGYVQTSRRYFMIARVPPGKDPRDTLFDAEMARIEASNLPAETVEYWRKHYRRWADGLGESGARDHYARRHASGDDKLTLTAEEFASFRAAGGGYGR